MTPRNLLPSLMTAVLLADLTGGVIDVAAGRSTWSSAWGPEATLCAPLPMIALQVLATIVAVRGRGWVARVAAGLLAAACRASVASGFFDGQLARADLSPAEIGFQIVLLTLTALLGVVAGVLAAAPARRPVRS